MTTPSSALAPSKKKIDVNDIPTNENTSERMAAIDELKLFLSTATNDWQSNRSIRCFELPSGENVSCVLWNDLFHITGTDIIRSLTYRFRAFGRPVCNLKKFEEGVFSDLRNLKPGTDACLEEPKSEFLEMLCKNNCIRTQKKQKVFYWFSVPHDRLFLDALERDLKRENTGVDPTSVAVAEPALSLSLDTTQDLFDQLKKSMSLSAEATAQALEITRTGENADTPSMTCITRTGKEEGTWNPSSHASSERRSRVRSYPGDLTQQPPFNVHQPKSVYSRSAHTSPKPFGEQFVEPLPGTPDECHHAGLMPSKSAEWQSKTKTIFGMFSLFEGSPNYKQRRRRAVSMSSSQQPILPERSCRHQRFASKTAVAVPTLISAASYNALASLTNSLADDGSNPNYTYTCPLGSCGRLFKRLEHLRRHLRTHTMERPYVCQLCGKRFSRSDNLAQHRKTHDRHKSPRKIADKKDKDENDGSYGNEQNGRDSHDSGNNNQSMDQWEATKDQSAEDFYSPQHSFESGRSATWLMMHGSATSSNTSSPVIDLAMPPHGRLASYDSQWSCSVVAQDYAPAYPSFVYSSGSSPEMLQTEDDMYQQQPLTLLSPFKSEDELGQTYDYLDINPYFASFSSPVSCTPSRAFDGSMAPF